MTSAVTAFEKAFADWCNAQRAFSFWKGRVAMYAILRALGVSDGDEVILPGYTCVMDVNPIKYLGATPTYVDIDPVTFNMDPSLLEKHITPRTRVIVAQHTYGIPCAMDDILDIANRHKVPVVEDCCLALGSTYKGRLCGTFGAAAYWSFQWNKPFTTGLGGMATTSDPLLAQRIADICQRELQPPAPKAATMLGLQRLIYRLFIFPRTTALATRLFRWLTRKGVVVGSSASSEFSPEMAPDFFTAMGTGQARAGLRQLRCVQANLAHRRQLRKVYDDLLRKANWPLPQLPEFLDPVLVRYPIRVADKQQALAQAADHFVEIGSWFESPLHPAETPMELYDYQPGMCPQAELACHQVVNLPTHPRTNLATAQRTVRFIQKIGPASL